MMAACTRAAAVTVHPLCPAVSVMMAETTSSDTDTLSPHHSATYASNRARRSGTVKALMDTWDLTLKGDMASGSDTAKVVIL